MNSRNIELVSKFPADNHKQNKYYIQTLALTDYAGANDAR